MHGLHIWRRVGGMTIKIRCRKDFHSTFSLTSMRNVEEKTESTYRSSG
jgi:hypothetical protein